MKNHHAGELSPEESLRIIDSILEQTKDNLSDSKFAFIFWGYFIAALSLLHHMLWNGGVEYHWIGWTFAPLAWSVTWLYYRNRSSESQVNGRVGKMFTWIWGILGINLFLLGFLGHDYIGAFIAILLFTTSWGALASGAILNFRPLIVGAIISNVIAIAALVVIPMNYHLLLCAIVAILCNIIPDYLLGSNRS